VGLVYPIYDAGNMDLVYRRNVGGLNNRVFASRLPPRYPRPQTTLTRDWCLGI
jgi:hypothetical protein